VTVPVGRAIVWLVVAKRTADPPAGSGAEVTVVITELENGSPPRAPETVPAKVVGPVANV
jgi:hypothetical protein